MKTIGAAIKVAARKRSAAKAARRRG